MPRRIAVLTARADDSEQSAVLEGVTQAALALGAEVDVFTNIYNHWVDDPVLNYENIIYELFDPRVYDGVIVTAEAFMDIAVLSRALEAVRAAGIPAAMIGGAWEGFTAVNSDDAADMRAMTEHLITGHGITDIDILTGFRGDETAVRRAEGCRQAFEAHGLPFDEERVVYGDFWTTSGEELARSYLSGARRMPAAVVCTSDNMAFGVCDVLSQAGVRIPEDITVTGYDHSGGRIYHYPLLTSFRRGRREMGIAAANAVLGGGYREGAGERFVRGNSCGCGADGSQQLAEITSARIGQYHTTMGSVAQLSARLTLCRTLAEYCGVLSEFSYLLHGARGMSLYLDREWGSDSPAGEEFLRCDIGGGAGEPPVKIPRGELLAASGGGRVRYLLPLVFQEKCFGHAALEYEYAQCYDISLRDYLKAAVNALEFLRMKNDIHYLSQCRRQSSLYDSLTGFCTLREFRQLVRSRGAGSLLAVEIAFATDGEYLYGENYRSDIIAAAANAIKQMCSPQELCCRTESGFVVLHRGGLFADKLMSAVHCGLVGRATERQAVVAFAQTEDISALDEVLSSAQERLLAQNELVRRRSENPYYEKLLALREEVQLHPNKAPTAQAASKRLCLSEGYFRAVYKECFGISYANDCIRARVLLAKHLLSSSAMSVYAVAMRCGYTDEKYFARQFRQSTGHAPLKYRTS